METNFNLAYSPSKRTVDAFPTMLLIRFNRKWSWDWIETMEDSQGKTGVTKRS